MEWSVAGGDDVSTGAGATHGVSGVARTTTSGKDLAIVNGDEASAGASHCVVGAAGTDSLGKGVSLKNSNPHTHTMQTISLNLSVTSNKARRRR
jgi:hypothetical protein